MDDGSRDLMQHNGIFAWIALGTALVLLIPAFAMQFTDEVSWSAEDFMVMGLLLFGAASLFVFVSRRAPRRRRPVIGVFIAAVFLYLWAELAVGVFTGLGS